MTTRQHAFLLALAVALAGALAAYGQDSRPWRAANIKAADAWTAAQTARLGNNTNVWIRRGVVADRAAHRVEVFAEATGLGGGAIAEFLLVGENSEKDYEALAVAFAKAGDVARALEFVGLPRGRPVKNAANCFWAKGERVRITLRQQGSGAVPAHPLHACLTDTRTKTTLPEMFVYTGSRWKDAAGDGVCRADEPVPGSIISTYNDFTTVIDVPGFAPQGEVYGDLVVDANSVLPKGALVLLTFTPVVRPDGRPRVVDVTLAVRPRDKSAGAGLGSLACVTQSADNALPSATNDVKEALARLAGLADGRDPFVILSFDDGVTVAAARDLTRVLKAVEGECGIRVEPPPEDQIYFKAFLPDDKWRTRTQRTSQPCELRVTRREDGTWGQTLVQIDEDWTNPNKIDPDLTVHEYLLKAPADLMEKVKAINQEVRALFVFAPGDAPLAAFMPAVRQLRARFPTVYVFCD